MIEDLVVLQIPYSKNSLWLNSKLLFSQFKPIYLRKLFQMYNIQYLPCVPECKVIPYFFFSRLFSSIAFFYSISVKNPRKRKNGQTLLKWWDYSTLKEDSGFPLILCWSFSGLPFQEKKMWKVRKTKAACTK